MMTDRKTLVNQNETPEDVATLYSWANLHGAKYRDFSASRAESREKARQRMLDSVEEERIAREEAEARKIAEVKRAAAAAQAAAALREAELAEQAAAAERAAAQFAAHQAAAQAAEQAAQQQAERAQQAAQQRARQEAAQAAQAAQAHFRQQSVGERIAPQPPGNRFSSAPLSAAPVRPQAPRAAESPAAAWGDDFALQGYRPQVAPPWEEPLPQSRAGAPPEEGAEPFGRPAWLVEEHVDLPSAPPLPAPPEDTLQGSRDRLTSRWFALKGIFESPAAPPEAPPAQMTSRAPVLAIFSLAGGVGKTSLVATLGRALSARGERVLLVDTAAYGLLPFYFGARDQRPGVLRTFTPPGSSGDAPLQMLTLDPETLGPESAPQEMLTQQIARYGRGASRVIVDLATASGATTRRVLRMAPTVLVPVVPDMNSVVSVGSIDAFFQHNSNPAGAKVVPYYVLNQFDATLPLHLDVREVLREQLGERLLPLSLRRTPAVSEALAEGMTVMDYAPNSTAAEDFSCLAGWLKNLAAPASPNFRGVRWSER
jgi:cellulose synthase operon protein YhjQ